MPFGNGRSYGDSCLNDGGILLDCRGLNRVISFDEDTGVITAEAGVLLSEVLALVVAKGWFLAVTPGTKHVTIGGAIANDVHGKNHHRRGNFGAHVEAFELLRSDGSRRRCSLQENADWFAATIGGLGLTGVIIWASLKLIPISCADIDQEVHRFTSLEEFQALAGAKDRTNEYSVAWVDSTAPGKAVGRGLYIRGDHAERQPGDKLEPSQRTRVNVPFTPPFPAVNAWSLKALNLLYFYRGIASNRKRRVHFEAFLYPLDSIGHWNRLYGPKGLLQHQSVLPMPDGIVAVHQMLMRCQRAGIGSFLTALKMFGDAPSPGLLPFPRPGITLTLDFPNQGARTFELLGELDRITTEARGAVNPCKDARMSAKVYQASFPNWQKLTPFIDPLFSSSFWRRVAA